MKSILLIGLGRFGRHIAMKLDELHHQVMAVDTDEKRVEAVLPYVTNAQIGDATDEEFLSSLHRSHWGQFPEFLGDHLPFKGAGSGLCGIQGSQGRPGQIPFEEWSGRGGVSRKTAGCLDRHPLQRRPHF